MALPNTVVPLTKFTVPPSTPTTLGVTNAVKTTALPGDALTGLTKLVERVNVVVVDPNVTFTAMAGAALAE